MFAMFGTDYPGTWCHISASEVPNHTDVKSLRCAEQSPWEANSASGSKALYVWWRIKVHCSVDISLQIVSVLCQISLDQAFPGCNVNIHVKFIHHCRLDQQVVVFLQNLQSKICMCFSSPSCMPRVLLISPYLIYLMKRPNFAVFFIVKFFCCLTLSVQRTKSMAFKERYPVRTKIVIDNKIIEQVNLFTYLGNMISYEENWTLITN